MGMASSIISAAGQGVAGTATIAGGILSTYSAFSQYSQEKENAKQQAALHSYNQRLEEREAATIESEAAENAKRQRESFEQLKSRQRAALGKSGAAMTSGSPLAVLGETAVDEEVRIQDTQRQAAQQASLHQAQANAYGYQSRVAQAHAPTITSRNLAIAGTWINVMGSLGSQAGSSANTISSFSSGKGK